MTYPFQRKLAASMIAVAAFSMSSTAVFAQQTQAPAPAPSGSQGSPAIDQGAIDSFAAASIEIQQILAKWEPRISSAQSEAQVQEIRENQEEELVAALQANDLDVSAYNRIFQAANNDPALAQRIQQRQQRLLQ
ncbi:DUF4168 domain-containing protein [Martelella soudanensis]|uniref:DUF4168 domain-containing protein n=1 Tax=unclassified Martelella TaxID=2629616 RepID=UPI0015DE7718|nr:MULTISPECIES: DUF4168 domain-containing protein [unclassified Martelella]